MDDVMWGVMWRDTPYSEREWDRLSADVVSAVNGRRGPSRAGYAPALEGRWEVFNLAGTRPPNTYQLYIGARGSQYDLEYTYLEYGPPETWRTGTRGTLRERTRRAVMQARENYLRDLRAGDPAAAWLQVAFRLIHMGFAVPDNLPPIDQIKPTGDAA